MPPQGNFNHSSRSLRRSSHAIYHSRSRFLRLQAFSSHSTEILTVYILVCFSFLPCEFYYDRKRHLLVGATSLEDKMRHMGRQPCVSDIVSFSTTSFDFVLSPEICLKRTDNSASASCQPSIPFVFRRSFCAYFSDKTIKSLELQQFLANLSNSALSLIHGIYIHSYRAYTYANQWQERKASQALSTPTGKESCWPY